MRGSVILREGGAHNDRGGNETKECEPRRESANGNTHLIPSVTKDSHDLQGEPCCGKSHAQLVTPFEESDGRQRGVETTIVDYPSVVLRYGTFADVMVVVAAMAVGSRMDRVCAFEVDDFFVDVEFEFEFGFAEGVAD